MLTSLKMEDMFDSILKITNSTDLKKFLHDCIDDLIEKRTINFDNYNSGPIEWTKKDFDKAKKSVQQYYKNCLTEDNVDTKSESINEDIKSCFLIRKNDIFQYLSKHYVLKCGYNLIENFDWSLRWVLGSSDLTVLKQVYLQIDLNGVENNKKTLVSFQVNLEQLDGIIRELKRVQVELTEKQYT